jgi:hypothetical protein
MNDGVEERTPSVETLSQRSFFVPAYQRGYRWTPDEVRELLEDIRQFAAESRDAEEFYCLQPLVVHRMASGQWEVIDGQQRLTTIYLITRYINEMWRGKRKDASLTLEYESRERTQQFLGSLTLREDGTVEFNDENIDFAHISKAYQAIGEWVTTQGSKLDQDQYMSAFRRRVRVIWYEPAGADSVQIFTRINRGKIPLTNAELIRALFLKASNFTKPGATAKEAEVGRLRQMELSGEWDRMEAALHDDKFWFFLTDTTDPAKTRIDLIFRLLTGIVGGDSYALFREYALHFPTEPDVGAVTEKWDEVRSCFQQLKGWYDDWEIYHLIGYLIATGTTLKELWDEARGLRKSDFKARLRGRIRELIPKEGLDKLEYGERAIRNVLLLHNVLTTLESEERHFRFPLSRFKKEKWDVEHIHSVAEKPPETEQHQREWLEEAAAHITTEALKKKVAKFLEKSGWAESEFDGIYKEVLKSFSEKGVIESINDLSNLALLDRGTNRGYGNAVFPVKRAKIIEREREGKFVPIATKNAFMKYYSKTVEKFTFWSEADRQAYFEAMEDTFEAFFERKKGAAQ